MAIKIAPKVEPSPKLAKALTLLTEMPVNMHVHVALESQKRKPTGKAKEAVTLRLSKPCVVYFKSTFGEDWRAEMQNILENGVKTSDP